MQIHGQSAAARFTTTVQLPRPAGDGPLLTLQPLPLGFARRLSAHAVQPPLPPVRIARDPQGKPLRQANGQAVTLADETDADYRRERELYGQRVAVLAVATALEADPHVRFETDATAYPQDWRPYADALLNELEQAGWTAGDLAWLCQAVCRMSNLLDQHLPESAADFPSGGPTVPD
jgi:hypothetical protein